MGLKFLSFQAVVVLVSVCSCVWAISLGSGPEDTDARLGDTVQLDCDVDYRQGRSILWYHEVRRLFLTRDRLVVDTLDPKLMNRLSITGSSFYSVFDLVIRDVQPEDDGYYYCGYSSDVFVVLGSARLTVLEPPSPESPTCDFAWLPGSNTTGNLSCKWTGGRPAPTATWYRDGDAMTGAEVRDGISQTRLELTADDNGAEFDCRLTSRAMDEERVCTVSPLRVPPVVTVSPPVRRAVVGSTAEFRCQATGLTRVRAYNWLAADGREFPRRARTRDGGQLLRLPDLRAQDDGLRVTCRAEIARGLTGEATAVLQVVPDRTTTMTPTTTTTVTTPAEPTTVADTITVPQTQVPSGDDRAPVRPDGSGIATTTMTAELTPPVDTSLSGRSSPPASVVAAAAAGACVALVVLVVVLVACVRRTRTSAPKSSPLGRDTSIQLVNGVYETVVEGGRMVSDPALSSRPGYKALTSPDQVSPTRPAVAGAYPSQEQSEPPRRYAPRQNNNNKPEQQLYANIQAQDETEVGEPGQTREPTYVNHGPAGTREEPDPRRFNAEGLTYAELDLEAPGYRVHASKNPTLYAKLK